MFSSSCRYGIRAVIYIAGQPHDSGKTGIKQIARDLNLPTPYLAKILQQLAKQKILKSLKGPHGGFSLLRDPDKITLFDIVKIIDGEEIFTNCLIHNDTCKSVGKKKLPCAVHEGYAGVRSDLVSLFKNTKISELVTKSDTGKYII